MNLRCLLVLICLLFFSLNCLPLSASDQTVRICNDIGEWPPYFYYQRSEDGTRTDRLVGATVDSLDAIFKKIGMAYEFELVPWQRCVAMVQRFDKIQKYEMFSEAGVNSWRQKRFLNTREPVYKRTDVFYYNREKYPDAIRIQSIKDMARYKICVAAGLSVERYIKAGLDEALIDASYRNYFEVIEMISKGRCDIMPANLAVIEGGVRVKRFDLPANVAHAPDVTIGKPFFYHYWISKSSPRAETLQRKIDQAIKELKASGEWEKIYMKHLSNGSGLSSP